MENLAYESIGVRGAHINVNSSSGVILCRGATFAVFH